MANLFSLANIPARDWIIPHHIEKNLTPSCLWSWSSGIMESYLALHYYNSAEVHAEKAWENKFAVSFTYWQKKHNFVSVCIFSFKIKQQDLIV